MVYTELYEQQERLRRKLATGMYSIDIPGQKSQVYCNELQMYATTGIGCHQISQGMRPLEFKDGAAGYSYSNVDEGLWLPIPGTTDLNVGYMLQKVLKQKQLVRFDVVDESFRFDAWGNKDVSTRTYNVCLLPAGWAAFGMFIGRYAAEITASKIIPNFASGNFDPNGNTGPSGEEDDESHADLGRFRGIF